MDCYNLSRVQLGQEQYSALTEINCTHPIGFFGLVVTQESLPKFQSGTLLFMANQISYLLAQKGRTLDFL